MRAFNKGDTVSLEATTFKVTGMQRKNSGDYIIQLDSGFSVPERCLKLVAETPQDKPTYREVKRAAKVGEKIKIIVNESGLYGPYYAGEITECIQENYADDPCAILAKCTHGSGPYRNGTTQLTSNEYVVLEPITPEPEKHVYKAGDR